ncbi:MAG: PAS domain S-box protein [Bryobacteraceae bacterium]
MVTDDLKTVKMLALAGENGNAGYRAMLEALPIAAYTTDAEGRLTWYNRAAAKLSGREPEIGTDQWCVTWRIYTPDGRLLPHDQCPMAIALKNGNPATGAEYLAERPDGSRFWFAPYPAVVRDADGRITGALNLLIDRTEQKRAEEEWNERFRAIVETTPECVKIVSADNKLLFMNTPGLGMVGASSAEDVIGRDISDLIAENDREKFREFNSRICRGEKGSLEFEIVGFDGRRSLMETYAAPIRHLDGTTAQLAITRDITDRKRADDAKLLLSAIVDSSDDAIISKDLNGYITSWNKSAERLFGYSAAEAVGQQVATLLIPADRQNEEPEILTRLRRGERVDHFETKRQHKDGTLLDISLTISPVKDPNGRIVGASKIARDIGESKRLEAVLLASEGRFRQLADAMPQIVWTARSDGRVDYFNSRWYEFTGFDRDRYGNASWESVLHPDDLERCREAWDASVRSGQPYNLEYRLFDRRESRWRWFVGRAVAVRETEGGAWKWFGACTDIDEQKRVQEDLRRANYDLEQFAFSASHDLQEPLRSIKIYSELLSRRHADLINEDAKAFLAFVQQGATRMELLVRDLLTYTRASALEAEHETACANDALQAALANLAGAIAETGAVIQADPLPTVPVHALHLQQLFQNLIGNAIKYRSPERLPAVHVTAQRQKGFWSFAVSDNGIGIESQYKENIFGLFKRLHTTDDYSGTGIGLALCRRIVDRYGGRIWVESEPGEGSTFRFTLPAGEHGPQTKTRAGGRG